MAPEQTRPAALRHGRRSLGVGCGSMAAFCGHLILVTIHDAEVALALSVGLQRRKPLRVRVEPRVPEVHDEHDARVLRQIPHLMLE